MDFFFILVTYITYKSTTFNRDLIDDYHFKSSKAPCYRQKIADNVSAVIT